MYQSQCFKVHYKFCDGVWVQENVLKLGGTITIQILYTSVFTAFWQVLVWKMGGWLRDWGFQVWEWGLEFWQWGFEIVLTLDTDRS